MFIRRQKKRRHSRKWMPSSVIIHGYTSPISGRKHKKPLQEISPCCRMKFQFWN